MKSQEEIHTHNELQKAYLLEQFTNPPPGIQKAPDENGNEPEKTEKEEETKDEELAHNL